MSDYIKREDALFIALQQPLYSVVSQIKQLEGIDIVRCKECRYYLQGECIALHTMSKADDYCSYGQKGDENVETD